MSLAVGNPLREAEINFLENLRADYEGRGYKFTVHPLASDLPKFLASYVPDALATKDDHNIAIELKSRATPAARQSIQKIGKLFEGRSDWRFIVAYMGSDPLELIRLPAVDAATILEQAREVEQLVKYGHLRAAFMTAWSLLEAALNSVQSDADKRPRVPGTVVQSLAMNGYISDEVDRSLRSLIDLRERVVHGDLTTEPSEEDVRFVLAAVGATLSRGSVDQAG